MRIILVIIVLFYTNNIFGQIVVIKDSLLNTPIENVNLIFQNSGVISNKNGTADISIFNNNEIIEISHVSYYSKKIRKETYKKISCN